MKRIISLFGIAIMATFALSAVSVATASAEELTKILTSGGAPTEAAPLTDVATQKEPGHLLAVGGLEVKCEKGSGTESWTSANLGKANVKFEGCTSALSTKCTSTGAATGVIETKGNVHFWLALLMLGKPKEEKPANLVSALVFLTEEVKFTCVNASKTIEHKVVVEPKGCVAAQDLPASLEKLVKEVKEEFKEFASGEQSILFVWPEGIKEEKEELPCLLSISVDGGAVELSALSGTLIISGYKKAGAAVEVELMK